jgi:succinate-semialdehyde dehydrogenase/glutarate-semialdehyde dehydrogenase
MPGLTLSVTRIVDSCPEGTMKAHNPATGELIAVYENDTEEGLEDKLEEAQQTYESWRQRDFETRAGLMFNAAEVLRENEQRYARLMTHEMGKPIEQAKSEVQKCAWVCDYYAEHAESQLAKEPIETDGSASGVRYEPLGPILAVMPWNFPFWQVFRFAAPNLMAGNVGLLKHAANVPGCAEAIEEVFVEANFPEAAFQTLMIGRDLTSKVIADDRVRGVTLTGSVGAGRAVASQAAEQLKPTVLELGGSDPFVVLEDANLEEVVDQAVLARTQNSGQSCIAAKRFIVVGDHHDEFVERLESALADLTVGDPTDPATDIGPMAREDLRDELHEQITESVEMGAVCRLGGEIPKEGELAEGAFYPPTLLTHLEPGMPGWSEETFGPVAAVVRAQDVDHAVRLANGSDFGLGASVWGPKEKARGLIPRLQAGHVAVNGIVKSDPRLPFGGIKDSGYGRELSRHGIREFVNAKTYWVQ